MTFTRYDMATLTRCPPRRSAKLLSQSASISRSQPSAAPALLGRGLVPRTNPNVGRRCHCATLKRGLEILSTHTYRGPLIRPGNLPSNHLSCFAMLGLGHSLQRACLDKSELMGQNRKAKEDKGLANERLKEEEIKRSTLFPSNRPERSEKSESLNFSLLSSKCIPALYLNLLQPWKQLHFSIKQHGHITATETVHF